MLSVLRSVRVELLAGPALLDRRPDQVLQGLRARMVLGRRRALLELMVGPGPPAPRAQPELRVPMARKVLMARLARD
jgi:hypothetical protein